ncbi:MAG: hypothetical protein ACLT38_10445 [Akkermansia sp.]
MDIRIERLSGDARHLKDLLDQGSWRLYQQALPVLNRELFDEDGGMTRKSWKTPCSSTTWSSRPLSGLPAGQLFHLDQRK